MRIKEKRFSVPFCIYEEPMPAKAFRLLVFLFSQSDFNGSSKPGYASMRLAMRDKAPENGCNSTVRRYLSYLQKRGWIFHMKRSSEKMFIWIQIPPRFRLKLKKADLISVVS